MDKSIANQRRLNADDLWTIPDAMVHTTDGSYSSALFEMRCQQELAKARDVPELLHKILKVADTLGFTDVSFARLASKNPTAAMILTTTPRALNDRYKHQEVWQNDLLLQHAMCCDEPIFKSTVDNYIAAAPIKTAALLVNIDSRAMAKSYGYLDCYDIPFKSLNGNGNALLSISTKHAESAALQKLVTRNAVALQILGRTIEYIGLRRFPEQFLDRDENAHIAIAPRPLRLLSTMAKENLSLYEAAKKLHMSRSTANKHIAAARAALGAKTNVAAIYRALQNGLIE